MNKNLIFKTYKALVSDLKNAELKICLIVFLSILTSFVDVFLVSICAYLISGINNTSTDYKFFFTLGDFFNNTFNSLDIAILLIFLCIISLFTKLIYNFYSYKLVSSSISRKSVACFSNLINNRDKIINKSSESEQITNFNFFSYLQFGVFQPLLNILSASTCTIILLVFYFIYTGFTGLILILIICSPYILSVNITKERIAKYSKFIESSNLSISSNINQSLRILSEIYLYGVQKKFIDKFRVSDQVLRSKSYKSNFLQIVPKFILESSVIIGFGLIIILNYLISGDTKSIFPIILMSLGLLQRLQPHVTSINGNYMQLKTYEFSLTTYLKLSRNEKNNYILKKIFCLHDENNLINLKDFSLTYDSKEKYIFKNQKLCIKRNSITTLIGKSGSGKSSLIKMLMGFLPSIEANGQFVLYKPNKNFEISYVPQEISLIDGSLEENIIFFHNKKSSSFAKKCLTLSGLDLKDINPDFSLNSQVKYNDSRFSGGQLQRIGIARALYRKPKLLIMDEPTSSLDKKTEKSLLSNLENLKSKITILLITHRSGPMEIADEIVKVQNGKIIMMKK